MCSGKLIVASSSIDEAITKCLWNNQQKLGLNLDLLLIQDLLNDYDIYDEINDRGAVIKWIKSDGQVISNQDSQLLNRVTYISDNFFKTFIKQDRLYAKSEFEAYLGFAFNAFNGVGNEHYNGLCVQFHALPHQWLKIKNNKAISKKLCVPNFYWGPTQYNDLTNTEHIIYSEVNNIVNWRESLCFDTNNHVFCFQKPIGQPVFTLGIGSKAMLVTDINLNQYAIDKIKKLTCQIKQQLNYFIAEVLFFVNKDYITFGCANHEIIVSDKHHQFDSFVCEHLIKEYSKCLNIRHL